MNILYISALYTRKNSSAAIRNNALVKGLIMLGHRVDVKTIDWGADESIFLNTEKNGNIYKYTLPAIKKVNQYKKNIASKYKILHRVVSYIKPLIMFPDNTKSWIRSYQYGNMAKEYDLMISSSDTKSAHLIASKIKQLSPGLRWIQIWGDPWTYDLNTPWYVKPISYLYEGEILKKADKVVYVSQLTAELMKNKFPKYANKLSYIPRSYYYECEQRPKSSDKNIKIVYTGTLAYGRNTEQLLKAINDFNTHSNNKIELHIYGAVAIPSSQLDASNVFVHGEVDYSQIKHVYEQGDFLLFISNKGKTITQIPGKLYDYLGCYQPIICLCDSEQTNLINYLKGISKCIIINNNYKSIYNFFDNLVCSNWSEYQGICYEYSPRNIAEQVLE